MSVLEGADIGDLLTLTIRDLGRFEWEDLASEFREYVVLPYFMDEKRVKFKGGAPGIRWQAMVDHGQSARNVGLYNKDIVDVKDHFKNATLDWRHSTANWAFDEREVDMQGSEETILDLVEERRAAAYLDTARLMEDNFFGLPDGSTDKDTPHGIFYWLVWTDNSATAPNGDFDGVHPTGFSDVGGLSATLYTRWKNWCAKYTNPTKTDLVKKIRIACTKTKWKPPIKVPEYGTDTDYAFLCEYDNLCHNLETIAEAQNDKLGRDIASMDGRVLIRRTEIMDVPKLEEDTFNSSVPFLGVNFGKFKTMFLKSRFMKEGKPRMSPDSHQVWETHVDSTYNWVCYNRRAGGFIIAKADPVASLN